MRDERQRLRGNKVRVMVGKRGGEREKERERGGEGVLELFWHDSINPHLRKTAKQPLHLLRECTQDEERAATAMTASGVCVCLCVCVSVM